MTTPLCFIISTGWTSSTVGQYYKAIGRRLAARGHRVVFVVDGQRARLEDHRANPAIYAWPSSRPTRPADFRFLRRLLAHYRPDGVVAAFGAVNVMMIAGWLSRVPVRVAWYTTVSQNADLDDVMSPRQLALLRWRKRPIYQASTHVAAVSAAAARDLSQVFGVREAKCHVWRRLLADPLSDVGSDGPRAEWRIVCAGRLFHVKGQDVLIRAMPELLGRFPRLQLELLGDGPQRGHNERLAAELGVADRVCFRGAVEPRRVLERMATATLVVVPSRSEALGAVNIEALAVATPVVATAVGGVGEIVRDGVEGCLVPPDDAGALADGIGRLLADPQLRATFGANARRRFIDHFDLDSHIDRHADWYEELVTGSAARPGARDALAPGQTRPTAAGG